jgi:hypothetical protein
MSVANSLPATCAYQQVLAHEMSDLKACFDQLRKVETLARGKLKNHLARQAFARKSVAGCAKIVVRH